MSTIVGIVENGLVHIGADTRVNVNNTAYCISDTKLWRQDDKIIGIAGYIRHAQILRKQSLGGMAVQDMAFEMPDWMEKAGALRSDDAGINIDSLFLVGHKGKLYIIDSYFSVSEMGEAAIGSGHAFALGALHATRVDVVASLGFDAIARIRVALAAAAQHDPMTAPPFEVLSQ